MMNKKELLIELNKWLSEFVEKPNAALDMWSVCPYARQARLKDKIEIILVEGNDFEKAINQAKIYLDSKDVVIMAFDHELVSYQNLQQLVENINKKFMQDNYVILEDHPDQPEFINGEKMNFGYCGILLMQRLSELNDAADKLREKGYYNNWSKNDYDDVVSWRYNK